MANLLFVDLDKFPTGQENIKAFLRLQPRAIVETSPGNYQAWLTLPNACSPQEALLVAKALTECFHADLGSVKPEQQGRPPGTVNVKDGKGCVAFLRKGCGQDIDESSFLEVTRGKRSCLKDRGLEVHALPLTGIGPTCPNRMDRSSQDWKMCCCYFETHPQASIDDRTPSLLQHTMWRKVHCARV